MGNNPITIERIIATRINWESAMSGSIPNCINIYGANDDVMIKYKVTTPNVISMKIKWRAMPNL